MSTKLAIKLHIDHEPYRDNVFTVCLYVAVTVLLCTLFFRQILPGHSYPRGPLPLPIVGNIWTVHKLNTDPEKTCQRLSDRYNDLCMLWNGSSPAVLVNSPHAAHEILHIVWIDYSLSLSI